MRKSIIAVVVLSALSASAFASSDFVGSGNYREDKAAQATRDAGQDAAIHQVHMNMLTKYSESWGLEDRANIAKLQESKLDKAVFEADQSRQDKALAAAIKDQAQVDRDQDHLTAQLHADTQQKLAGKVSQSDFNADQQRQDSHINAVQDAAQSANEKADAGAIRADRIEKQAGVLDNRVGNTEVRLDKAEGGIRSEQSAREAGDAGLSERINTKVDNGVFQQRSAVVDSRFADTQQRIDNNKAEQAKVNKAVASTLSNHESRISDLESSTKSRFSDIDKRIDDNKRNADAGIAGVAAMANIPQVTESQSFAVGAGVGSREGESAVAVGVSFRASQNVVVKATVAGDTQQSWTVGAGVSYGW